MVPHGFQLQLQMLWVFDALGYPERGSGALDFRASTHQLGYTISDLMAKKKIGKTGSAAGDPSYARLHGAARDLSFIQPAASAAEQDMGRGCFGKL